MTTVYFFKEVSKFPRILTYFTPNSSKMGRVCLLFALMLNRDPITRRQVEKWKQSSKQGFYLPMKGRWRKNQQTKHYHPDHCTIPIDHTHRKREIKKQGELDHFLGYLAQYCCCWYGFIRYLFFTTTYCILKNNKYAFQIIFFYTRLTVKKRYDKIKKNLLNSYISVEQVKSRKKRSKCRKHNKNKEN